MWWTSDSRHSPWLREFSQDRQPEIRPSGGKILKELWGRPNKDCRSRKFTLTNSPTPTTFACWKIRFKTEVCTSQFPTEAMLWIKEVEMVESVDDLKSTFYQRNSWSRLWVARREKCFSTEQNHPEYPLEEKRSVKRNRKAQKQDRFLRGRQIAYLIYEFFWITGANDSVENYADLFTIVLRNDDIQFDSKWDGIILSMTKIPSDDIFEGLYKSRIRESEKLKTVLDLYDLRFIRRKQDLIITDWRRWWKEVSSRLWEWRTLKPEMEILKQAPWSRIKR